MDKASVELTFAWWLMPYLTALYWVADFMRSTPDDAHVEWVMEKAARFTVHCDGLQRFTVQIDG